MLATNWRDNAAIVANAEAFLRIERVFTSYAQRNANADMTNCITKYGADPATWPADARDRKTIGDQGWTYVNSVRQKANAMAKALAGRSHRRLALADGNPPHQLSDHLRRSSSSGCRSLVAEP